MPVQVGDAQQGGEFDVGAERLGGLGAESHPVGREQFRQRGGADGAELVGPAQGGGLFLALTVGPDQVQQAVGELQPQGRPAGPPGQRGAEVEHHGIAQSGAVEAVAAGGCDSVQHDHGERLFPAGYGVGVERRPLRNSAPSRSSSSLNDGAMSPSSIGVACAGAVGVREPLRPVPLGHDRRRGEDRDPQVLGCRAPPGLPGH